MTKDWLDDDADEMMKHRIEDSNDLGHDHDHEGERFGRRR